MSADMQVTLSTVQSFPQAVIFVVTPVDDLTKTLTGFEGFHKDARRQAYLGETISFGLDDVSVNKDFVSFVIDIPDTATMKVANVTPCVPEGVDETWVKAQAEAMTADITAFLSKDEPKKPVRKEKKAPAVKVKKASAAKAVVGKVEKGQEPKAKAAAVRAKIAAKKADAPAVADEPEAEKVVLGWAIPVARRVGNGRFTRIPR